MFNKKIEEDIDGMKFLRKLYSQLKNEEVIFNDTRAKLLNGEDIINEINTIIKTDKSLDGVIDGEEFCKELILKGYLKKVKIDAIKEQNNSLNEKVKFKVVSSINDKYWEKGALYVWILNESTFGQSLQSICFFGFILTFVLYPLWPKFAYLGARYIALGISGILCILLIISLIRFLIYVITLVIFKKGMWIFPNLYADVGIADSFIPFLSWEE